MATLPAFLRRTDTGGTDGQAGPTVTPRPERDPFQLRTLPLESVVFFCKKIDNTRLVREPDPRNRRACLSAIGTACAVVALLGGALAPRVATRIAGYRLETLRLEERQLLDERRVLEVRQAAILSPQQLEQLARQQGLSAPVAGQVTHLSGKAADGTLAMAGK